jgi:hypothetical protein
MRVQGRKLFQKEKEDKQSHVTNLEISISRELMCIHATLEPSHHPALLILSHSSLEEVGLAPALSHNFIMLIE